jgi:hypothetical protein
MYININGTRIAKDGIVSYSPILKDGGLYSILITYETTEIEISVSKDKIINWLEKIDKELI